VCIGLMQSDWVAEDLDPSSLGLDILILTRYKRARACLSIFIYGKTNKQFRACGNIVYGETGKIREFALSRYPRQDNYNVNKTKSYYLISSKLTPVDAS